MKYNLKISKEKTLRELMEELIDTVTAKRYQVDSFLFSLLALKSLSHIYSPGKTGGKERACNFSTSEHIHALFTLHLYRCFQ